MRIVMACALLGISALVAPAPKTLLVSGSEANPVALGLAALGVGHDRFVPADYSQVSPFDYDLIIWGMDDTRAPLAADPEAIAAFVQTGGVLLGFRCQEDEPWLPVPARHDKAYQLGRVLQPKHPIFTTPHAFSEEQLRAVHGGSIYKGFYALGEGWTPLVSTGAEQSWDKTPVQDPGEHYGLIELAFGRGRIVLVQMIPAYHWFKDSGGDADSLGARLFENLVRYALAQAPARAAARPPRALPDGFHPTLETVIATPRRGAGVPLDDPGWEFTSNGPYTMKVDRRGVLCFTHADTPSRAGGFAQVRRPLEIPPDAESVTLRWYESDTYCGGREVILGGPEHGKTALENYKRDLRYKQVLVNGQVVWEEDVLGRNPQPAVKRFRTVDITAQVRAAGGTCEVALRVEDRAGSGEDPFYIDVFFATVELIADLRRAPAAAALTGDGFEADGEGELVLTGDAGALTARPAVAAGRYAVALRLRDEHTGRSDLRILADGRLVAAWKLTADDYRWYWAVAPAVELRPDSTVRVEAAKDGDETVVVREIAIIPERMLAVPAPPAVSPAAAGGGTPRVSFPVRVVETAGVARRGEVAAQGLPFPVGCVSDPGRIRVIDADGQAVPVQTRVIAPWSDGSAKAALVAFPVTVAAKATATYTVEAGEGVAAPSAGGLTVAEQNDALVIDTGVITATVSTTHGRIVDEVRREGAVVKAADEVWELVLVDEAGRVVRSGGPTVTETEVVERGPVRALIVRKGSFADADGELVEYRIQLEATAGSDALLVQPTIVNREGGDVYLKRWSLHLARPDAAGGRIWLGEEETRAANDGARLYQHREDTLTWTGADGRREWAAGRSPGYLRLPGLGVGTRWFWQRYPQAVEFGADEVRLDFMPEPYDERDLPTRWRDRLLEMTDRYQVGGVGYPRVPGKMGLHCLSRGEALSQEVLLAFDARGVEATDRAVFAPLTAALRAVPDPAYAGATGAFGEYAAANPRLFERYEQSVERTYQGYLAKRDKRREYGFENFGDDTFEWGYGPSYTYWSNSEYDHHHGFALQYLRSGDPKWWELCEQTARHYRDVVVVHHGPQKGGPHHHNATNMWMPQHDEQYWIADHTLAGCNAGHSWVQGMIDYWFLTGDPWAGEVVREQADWYCGIVENNRYGAGGQERGPGWALIAVSALTSALGDERLYDAGWSIADWILDWQDPIRGVLSVPISEQPSYEGGTVFMHGIVGRALGRWYDLTGDLRVRDAALAIGDWLTTEPMGDIATFWYKQSPHNSRRYGATDQTMTALSYAYDLSDDPWFAEVALALLQRTGANIRSMAWYPQALAHLEPLLTPAATTLASARVVVAPAAPGDNRLLIRNTGDVAVTCAVAIEVDPPFDIRPGEPVTVPAGAAAAIPLKVSATAPARGEAVAVIELRTPGGETTVRRLSFQVEALARLARVEVGVAEALVSGPMSVIGEGDEAYLATPRGPDYVPRPRPEDGESGGSAIWTMEIPADGEYTIWGEVYWLDEEGNSFYVSAGDGAEMLYGNRGAIGQWIWLDGPKVRLAAGRCKLKVRCREDGARIRRVRLTSIPGDRPSK